MRQIPLSSARIRPGRAYEWQVVLTGPPTASGPASYSQARHLAATRTALAMTTVHAPNTLFIAGTFEIPGAVDLTALEASFHHVVQRHDVLRTRYHGTTGDVHHADLTRTDHGQLKSTDDVRTYLHERFRRVCGFRGPTAIFGVVVRNDGASVYLALDHLIGDVVSMALAAHDITSAYEQIRAGSRPELPPTGSWLAYTETERADNQSLHADRPELAPWRDFASGTGSLLPWFPLESGRRPGNGQSALRPRPRPDPGQLPAGLGAAGTGAGSGHRIPPGELPFVPGLPPAAGRRDRVPVDLRDPGALPLVLP
ncbi:hypothetical protein J2S57_004581 [Kineosporia succinea]|uniref:Condensation domain-containing protein n=1 Tax=Kineosporia succinea TaxID=84632 RepID=A0ABT9P808_9ACTN|nr:condensation domain-containing protein [Kineosporia succinea]MDP9828832.1 hypothetical protein [Kineosporia succinea]